jgi:hypothetical protein
MVYLALLKLDGVPLYSKTLANEMKKMVNKDCWHSVIARQSGTPVTRAGASTAVVASIGENGCKL